MVTTKEFSQLRLIACFCSIFGCVVSVSLADEIAVQPKTDRFTWGAVRSGWQVGVRLLSSDGRLNAGDPAVFQFALKNPTEKERTVVIKQFEGLYPALGANNRISLNISGSSQRKHQHTVAAGKVLEARQYRVVLNTEGLPDGNYHVSRATPFWVPDKEHPNRSSGLSLRVPISFTIGEPEKKKLSKLPSADSKEEQIYWGDPVAGLVVGMRLPDGKSKREFDEVLSGELFVRNLSTKPIHFEYEIPGSSDWNTHVETADGDYVRLNAVWDSGFRPRITKEVTLRPFEQKRIFGLDEKDAELSRGPQIHVVQTDKELKQHVPRHLITDGGEFRWFAHISIRQFAVKDLTMIVGSSGVPFKLQADEE